VAKNINLAAKLADGAKIYIPKIGEITVQAAGADNQYPSTATIKLN